MNFIKRNKSIFVIGLVFGVVFIVIAILGQQNNSGASLISNLESPFKVKQKEVEDSPDYTPPESSPKPTIVVPPKEPKRERQIILPIIEIVFTEEGFNPNSLQAIEDQVIRWTNGTEREISVKELVEMHMEFANGVIIAPGGTYELKLYGTGMWTFKELGSGKIGRLLITPKP